MKVEMRKAGINLKTFAKIVKINRNYFASLLNSPLQWESCTKTQRDVYQSMKVWIDFRQNKTENNQISKPEGISRKALKPINREVKHSNAIGGKTVNKQTRYVWILFGIYYFFSISHSRYFRNNRIYIFGVFTSDWGRLHQLSHFQLQILTPIFSPL